MTRPCTFILLAAAGAILVAGGCAPSDSRDGGDSATLSAPVDSTTTAVHDVVQTHIWEQTAEGSPYFIRSSATQFDRLEKDVIHDDGSVICRALFQREDSTFLVEYILRRELEHYVITRVLLKAVNDEPVDDLLYDRATLIQ